MASVVVWPSNCIQHLQHVLPSQALSTDWLSTTRGLLRSVLQTFLRCYAASYQRWTGSCPFPQTGKYHPISGTAQDALFPVLPELPTTRVVWRDGSFRTSPSVVWFMPQTFPITNTCQYWVISIKVTHINSYRYIYIYPSYQFHITEYRTAILTYHIVIWISKS